MSQITGSVVEIILACLIPFIWWIAAARKKKSFFHWIGLKKIDGEKQSAVLRMTLIIMAAFIGVFIFILYLTKDIATAASEFQ